MLFMLIILGTENFKAPFLGSKKPEFANKKGFKPIDGKILKIR